MTGMAMKKYGAIRKPVQHLGERVRGFLEPLGLTEKELAIKANIDVRTARSAKEGSCGPHTFDALARAFGWDFVDHVMTPAIGADPITARERELEIERQEIAAREARLDRLRAAMRPRGAEVRSWPRLADEEDRAATP